jgi:ankyrin repeat protein
MLRKSLATLPPTLDQTYDRILIEIDENDSMYAFRILQWLAFSTRPLTVEEVAEAAAVDSERDPAFERDEILEDPLEALNICSSLVTMTVNSKDARINPGARILVLSHYSVQEYLLSERIRQGKARQYSMQVALSHGVIAKGCLEYLLQLQQPNTSPEHILQNFALAHYSANSWMDHAQRSGQLIDEINQLAINLLSVKNPSYMIWVRLFSRDFTWTKGVRQRSTIKTPEPLYYAALTGLDSLVGLMLDNGADINALGGEQNSALQAAAYLGRDQVVRLLLARGADVNMEGDAENHIPEEDQPDKAKFPNALHSASWGGYEQLVKLLLDHGAKVNVQGGLLVTALQIASAIGHYEVVKILLDHDADVNIQGGQHVNALHAACKFNNVEVVKLLLKKNAKMTGCGDGGDTALNIAVTKGRVEITELLLESGAYSSANGLDPQFGTIMNLFAFHGYTDSIRFYHEKTNADLFLTELYGRTPLLLAARGGHIDTFQYLIEQGLDPFATDVKRDGLICYAAGSNLTEMIEAVFNTFQTTKKPNSNDGLCTLSESSYWTPLHWACRAGNFELLEQLVEKGFRSRCVTTTQPQDDWSPLDVARYHGNEEMLNRLSASCVSILDAGGSATRSCGKSRGKTYLCSLCLHVS